MLKIAICDDENFFRDSVKKYVEKYLSENNFLYEVDTFESGKAFIELGVELMRYDIIFLDVNMDDIDGMVTVQKIREYSSKVYIVFVTSSINYSLEGYKVDVVRYLLKNSTDFENSIYECMDAILHKMNYVVTKKVFKFNEGKKEVPIENILYIESKLHKLEFHIMEKELKKYILYGTLNEMEKEMIGFSFVRVHQSFLVNLKYIKALTGYKVILINNQELSIPKARYKEVKSKIIAYNGQCYGALHQCK